MRLAGRKALLMAGVLAGAGALLLAIWSARDAGPQGGAEGEGARAAGASDRAGDRSAARNPLQDLNIRVQQHQRERARTGPGGEPLEVLEARFERVQSNLDRYRHATRYPPNSRPLAEQPDQAEPHSVPPQRLPLVRDDGKPSDKAAVILRQDYYYLAGSEAVTLSVECGTLEGSVPCEILSSTAMSPGGAQHADVPFTAQAAGALHEAMFQPGAEGFADYYGPIRVEVAIRIAGETGTAAFDLEYTPKPPAVFTGRVSEKLVDGSLVLGVELQIEKPGRYVLAARVEDAAERSFAYVSFNDELPRGRAEAALVVFGKLVLDEKARAPFRLRDVEGFLLKEDVSPDRELLPTLEGVVYTTKAYREQDFSDAEWQSEERSRHLDELGRQAERAKNELEDAKR
jgi:hypothetical protein